MGQKRKKPTRSRSHELEDESYTKFRAARPSAWPVHKIDGSDDYGRDLLVEIFENHQPTGNEFSVQLKAKEKLVGPPKAKLNVSTLNHWEDQPSPTLIVLWDAATDQLYYEWAHRLPWSDPKHDKTTRTVPVPHLWSETTPEILAEEADAFRKVRDLGRYFPVDVEVRGDEYFGGDAGPVVSAIIDGFSSFPDLVVSFSKPRVPFIRVEVLANGVEVSMSGTPVKRITYEPSAPPPPEVIAADALFALAFAVGTIGRSRDVGTALLCASVERSFMAIVAGRLADAIVLLVRADARDALLTLLARTLTVEHHPSWSEALAGVEATKAIMADALRMAIASSLEQTSKSWSSPARALRTAAWLVGPLDADRAMELWEAAVEADPSTKDNPRYWSELGGISFLWERWDDAVANYRKAVRLGDKASRPLLADALMWAGHYADALGQFNTAGILDGDDNAEWRLKSKALRFIVEVVGINQQKRDDFVAEMMWRDNLPSPPSVELIEQVIEVDALYAWAYWAACPGMRDRGVEPVGPLLVAAVCQPSRAPIVQELTTAALRTGNWETARDALLLARRMCGPDFIRMVHTDEVIDRELRALLLKLWGCLDDRDDFFAELEKIQSEQQAEEVEAPSVDDHGGSPNRTG